MRKLLVGLALASPLILGCESLSEPTQVDVTGTLVGASNEITVDMSHGRNLANSQSIVGAVDSVGAGQVEALKLDIDLEGVATTTGYELVAVTNQFSIGGGGGIFRGASAGDSSLFRLNTGTVAKTSYYFFEDSGSESSFTLPNNSSTATRLVLGRVQVKNSSVAKIPFVESNAALRTDFFGLGCLSDQGGPCFDVSSLVSRLFASLRSGLVSTVEGNDSLSLGGDDEDGDFRMDYLPFSTAKRGCGATPNEDPAFGFIFSGTINAPLGTSVRVRIPMLFSMTSFGSEFTVLARPLNDVGTCQESQFMDRITVHVSTILGIGAQGIADDTQKSIVCSMFGPTLESYDCTGIAATPLSGVLVAGLEAMVGNTARYYWRQVHGNTNVPDQFGLMMRPRNADNQMTTTNVTPGSSDAVQVEVVFTQ